MTYALSGFFLAVILIMMVVVIWQLAKAKLEHWSYDLNRETHRQLHEAELKLDSIVRGQERILAQMERLSSTVKTA